MNQDEQIRFVEELSGNIAGSIIDQIHSGKIPDEWDGIELSWLLGYRHEQSARMTRNSTYRRRKAEFNNTILINNL